jgi:hypothetical protein
MQQLTKVVMRRDLAVARSKSGTETTALPVKVPSVTTTNPVVSEGIEAPPSEVKPANVEATETVSPQLETAKPAEAPTATSSNKRPSPSHEDSTIDEHATKKQALGDKVAVSIEPQTSDTKLELDTKLSEQVSGEQSADDKAPDTATFSNTGDLDSLFNDPTSAGGMGGDAGNEPDFSTSADLNADFDFQSFNDASTSNDNDNISALLPGLQDYANDTSGAEPDFSSFFNPDPNVNLNVTDQPSGSNTAMGQQQIDTAQGDSTFEDLFDLTFDMSGGNDGNQNGGNDFNFDFS